jgi:hypothetical protein
MTGIASLVLITSVALGQAPEPKPNTVMQQFARDFSGTWTGTTRPDYAIPGVKAGDALVTTARFTEAFPGAIVLTITAEADGKNVMNVTGVAGLDPKSGKQIKLTWHRSDGATGVVTYSLGDKMWVTQWYSIDADKIEETADGTVEFPNDRTQVIKYHNRKRGGKGLPAVALTFTRVVDTAYEHLKPLEWAIGDWVGEWSLPYDLPPFKQGDRVGYHASSRWIMNRNYLVVDTYMVGKDGRRAPDTHEIIGWDPAKKKVVHSIYGADGTGNGEWTETGKQARLRWSFDSKEGRLEGTSYMEVKDANTHTWQVKNVTLKGEKQDDWPLVTFKRKTVTANEHLKLLAPTVGHWSMEGKWADGVAFKGEEHSRWVLNGHFIRGQGWYIERDGTRMEYEYQIGWDPKKTQPVMHFHTSDGATGTRTGSLDAKARTWTCSHTFIRPDKSSGSYDHVLKFENDNRVLWTGKNWKVPGGMLPDLEITFARK